MLYLERKVYISMGDWWNTLSLATQIFYCIAIPATLVLLIQTVLMLFGLGNDADGDFDAPDVDFDSDLEVPDTELDDGLFGGSDSIDLDDASGIDSLHIFTLRGIIAFFVVLGWVGVVMQLANINLAVTLLVAFLSGFAIMLLIAYLFKAIMKLKNDGTADNRNALGSAGRVHLTIPPSRTGEGKVHIMLQGSYVERNAVTDEGESIPTGCEIIVVGTSGQTDLVVKRK